MAKGFDRNEKQLINDALIEQGKLLFSQYGLQKTSIRDLTKNVGIAQGTFYNFFQSKEELYFIILESEEAKFQQHLASRDFSQEPEPKEAMKQMLRELINNVETNPIIRELYTGDTLKKVVRKLPPELLEEHFNQDTDYFLFFIKKWKKQGLMIKNTPEVIAGIFRSLFLLTLHQEEIGEFIYRETMELLIDSIVDGFLEEE